MKIKIEKGALVVYNKWIPSFHKAMNFCGSIFARSELNESDLEHESVHSKQVVEVGVMFSPIWVALSFIYSLWFVLLFPTFYYTWYGAEWCVRYLKLRDGHKAYRAISFEREAYEGRKKRFGWFKYLSFPY